MEQKQKKDAASIGEATSTREATVQDPSEEGCCCSGKTKVRDEKEYKALYNRLSRIEGQVRGLKTMLEENAYCTDILVQVAAVSSALNSFSRVLLENHIRTCVTRDILEGKEETVDELMDTLNKLIR